MSDDEGDVVVMRVCFAVKCSEMMGLEFDEEMGEFFCQRCAVKLRHATETGDYTPFLTFEDKKAAQVIFDHFDVHRQGYWTYNEFNNFLVAVYHPDPESDDHPVTLDSNAEMAEYLRDEYGIGCDVVEVPAASLGLPEEESAVGVGNVVTPHTLHQIYGVAFCHGTNMLEDDLRALDDDGVVSLARLE